MVSQGFGILSYKDNWALDSVVSAPAVTNKQFFGYLVRLGQSTKNYIGNLPGGRIEATQ